MLTSVLLCFFLVSLQESTPYSVDPKTGQHVQTYPDYGSAVESSVKQARRRPMLSNAMSPTNTELIVESNWPNSSKQLGQVAAVTVDQHGQVIVLHRGTHIWNGQTFNQSYQYLLKEKGAVRENPVVIFHPKTGETVGEWGSNLFYMPHGLFVDHEDNLWLTDVALHQVFKFPPLSTLTSNGSSSSPLIQLGERFIPGRDKSHFCQPSDVAVLRTGEFFVSDGYCNSRIIKYSKDGHRLLTWGRSVFSGRGLGRQPPPYHLYVPHALTIAEDRGLVCVADRENGRVQCFFSANGTFSYQITSERFGSRVFSVAYSPSNGGVFYIVNGPDIFQTPVCGFVVDANNLQVLSEFRLGSTDLSNPHDVAVSPDGGSVYVAQLDPHRTWKFIHKDGWNASNRPLSVVSSTNAPQVSVAQPQTAGLTKNMVPSAPTNSTSIFPSGLNLMASSSLGKSMTSSFAAIAGLAIILLCLLGVGIALCIRVRRRAALTARQVDGFNLGNLLDARNRRGFEQISTEESDEEGTDIDQRA